jgi:type II secretory pathway pseudopilin PulG
MASRQGSEMATGLISRPRRRGFAGVGFSLVELLVTAAIFIFVLGALGGLLVSSTRAYQVNAVRSEALQDSEAVLQIMRYEVGLAGYRGLGAATFDQPFTMGAPETVDVRRLVTGDELTVRYFEDRFLESGDSGERAVTFRVDPASSTLERVERKAGVGALVVTELLVGNIQAMRVLDLVGPDRERVSVAGVLATTEAAPDALAGLHFRVTFVDGSNWEFLIGLTNPQVFAVRSD